ncbi:ArsC family reductase [Vibrio natriegens]|uniref:Arsenate reductase n=1 Tax=Vibrio natriegens NBRC 15636 = ATCC 14048 = DSM 759 TaxID=1219067 RepID=A0AAN0Y3H8_VIBNA|nr:ArsC family reductase [Vibrio natriegens]ALR14905.1 ArsC family transcriptional regulator [Vibrio natriegens NBRC 15636 = ATCC 14048 = DSM 759]ANQ13231.1 arsenate reductase [Vibrio natriegens NBRC 15636 = ATCC 14048 = DSM 759]EPM41838.1 glutathione-dependent thiol reductase [Vibrio natriegens NBRC 15636 = ATCC 14048 = DSM 759]MDX6027661.1 ArsC family reductase [Vibrio natriegens NBRC 15636 = ATCC 14048 = DSM 759]UUI10972.1 ArsC family reductase [Vibrio natriegens]
MTITMFGIPNCDTIKKAKKWLEAEDIAYEFHDYRKQGVDEALVTEFCDALGWENVLNKRGTTFRQLTQEQKDSLNEENAIKLLVENPAMIKRPILKVNDQLHIGFKADQYTTIFNS